MIRYYVARRKTDYGHIVYGVKDSRGRWLGSWNYTHNEYREASDLENTERFCSDLQAGAMRSVYDRIDVVDNYAEVKLLRILTHRKSPIVQHTESVYSGADVVVDGVRKRTMRPRKHQLAATVHGDALAGQAYELLRSHALDVWDQLQKGHVVPMADVRMDAEQLTESVLCMLAIKAKNKGQRLCVNSGMMGLAPA